MASDSSPSPDLAVLQRGEAVGTPPATDTHHTAPRGTRPFRDTPRPEAPRRLTCRTGARPSVRPGSGEALTGVRDAHGGAALLHGGGAVQGVLVLVQNGRHGAQRPHQRPPPTAASASPHVSRLTCPPAAAPRLRRGRPLPAPPLPE